VCVCANPATLCSDLEGETASGLRYAFHQSPFKQLKVINDAIAGLVPAHTSSSSPSSSACALRGPLFDGDVVELEEDEEAELEELDEEAELEEEEEEEEDEEDADARPRRKRAALEKTSR
jgi:hypothetical protein